MKYINVFSVFFMFKLCYGQQLPEYAILPDKIPTEYFRDYIEAEKFARTYGNFENIKDSSIVNLLYKNLAVSDYESLLEGEVFYNWTEATLYLNNVLEKLTKDLNPEVKKYLKVYPGFSANINAGCYHSGVIIFDMGSFNYLKNEAQVAAILSHEISHFVLKHSYSGLEKEALIKDSERKPLFPKKEKPFRTRLQTGQFSQKNEIQADSLGLFIFAGAGYKKEIYLEVEELFLRLDQSLERFKDYTKPSKKDLLISSHPSSEQRIAKIKELLQKVNSNSEVSFFQNEDSFNNLVNQSKLAAISVLNKRGEYYSLTEFCFINYLIEPENKIYIYYILEGIRKYCYSNHSTWNNRFLTDKYKSWRNIMKQLNGGNKHIDLSYKIKDGDLLEKSENVSHYYKAFDYFTKKAEELKIEEAYLSSALGYHDQDNVSLVSSLIMANSEKSDYYLLKYASTPNVLNSDYASFLIGKKEIKTNDTTLIVLADLDLIEYDRTKNFKDLSVFGKQERDTLKKCIKEFYVKNQAKMKIKLVDTYANQNFMLNQYIDQFIFANVAYNKIWSRYDSKLIKNGEIKYDIPSMFYFDPNIYNYYFKNGNYSRIIIYDIAIECKLPTGKKIMDFQRFKGDASRLYIDVKKRKSYFYPPGLIVAAGPNLNFVISKILNAR